MLDQVHLSMKKHIQTFQVKVVRVHGANVTLLHEALSSTGSFHACTDYTCTHTRTCTSKTHTHTHTHTQVTLQGLGEVITEGLIRLSTNTALSNLHCIRRQNDILVFFMLILNSSGIFFFKDLVSAMNLLHCIEWGELLHTAATNTQYSHTHNIHAHTHTHAQTYAHAHRHTQAHTTHVHTHTYIHTHARTHTLALTLAMPCTYHSQSLSTHCPQRVLVAHSHPQAGCLHLLLVPAQLSPVS